MEVDQAAEVELYYGSCLWPRVEAGVVVNSSCGFAAGGPEAVRVDRVDSFADSTGTFVPVCTPVEFDFLLPRDTEENDWRLVVQPLDRYWPLASEVPSQRSEVARLILTDMETQCLETVSIDSTLGCEHKWGHRSILGPPVQKNSNAVESETARV